jgi:chromosome segregation ATPase
VDKIRTLEDKIFSVIEKAKALKLEKDGLQRRVEELEGQVAQGQNELNTLREELNSKNTEIDTIRNDKNSVAEQIDAILGELDSIDI